MVIVDVPNGPVVVRTNDMKTNWPPIGLRGWVEKIQVGIPHTTNRAVFLHIAWRGAMRVPAGGWFASHFRLENGEHYIPPETVKRLESADSEFEIQMILGALLADGTTKEGK